jgi:hypothetical protein
MQKELFANRSTSSECVSYEMRNRVAAWDKEQWVVRQVLKP